MHTHTVHFCAQHSFMTCMYYVDMWRGKEKTREIGGEIMKTEKINGVEVGGGDILTLLVVWGVWMCIRIWGMYSNSGQWVGIWEGVPEGYGNLQKSWGMSKIVNIIL